MDKVSIIIPGRCETYFQQTIDSVLDRANGDVEVIAVVDGYEPDPPLVAKDHRVKIIKVEKSIGQRAGYNLGVRESTGKFVMKIDAHCLLSKGFDTELKSHCPDNAVVLPEMRRLDVHKWESKPRGKTHFMYFGNDLYCHFWKEYKKRDGIKQQEYPEVMTGQGSCWFCTRKWNDHIELLDEGVGSWGNVGIEVSLRTWLCGGTQIVNKKAWQAHYFRKDEGGFPYPMDGRKVWKAHNYTRKNYYYNDNAFKNQTRKFKYLIEKFAPVPGWEAYLVDEYKSPRVIVYYTDNKIDSLLGKQVRKRIEKIAGKIPIISVSQEPISFGKNICVGPKPREYKSIYEQILVGVEATEPGSIIYLCEHDVFYHPSHFAFLPTSKRRMFFNRNRFYWSLGMDGFFPSRGTMALSQSVTHRNYLIKHCKSRIDKWNNNIEHTMKVANKGFRSDRPNVDIRHDNNFTTHGKYKKSYMKGNRKTCTNLPGWGGSKHFQSITGYKVV